VRCRSPVPQELEQADQAETSHWHPLTWTQLSSDVGSGALLPQSAGAPEGHDKFRNRSPTPQELLQVDHSPSAQLQPAVSKQRSAAAGRAESIQSASEPLEQFTARVRVPSPHCVLHGLQAEAAQVQAEVA
jgi:hypothetical protein